jgi:hypothetical protein
LRFIALHTKHFIAQLINAEPFLAGQSKRDDGIIACRTVPLCECIVVMRMNNVILFNSEANGIPWQINETISKGDPHI